MLLTFSIYSVWLQKQSGAFFARSNEPTDTVNNIVLYLVVIACAVKCRIVPCGKQEKIAEMLEVCIAASQSFEVITLRLQA